MASQENPELIFLNGHAKSQVFTEELPLRETQRKQTRFFTSEDKKMKAIMKWIRKVIESI